MARKKSKADQVKIATRRLVEDEEVHKQLRLATARVREAWGRASGRPASKAVADKKVYSKVREAATSLVGAGHRLRRQPEPPKHTGRKVVVGAAMAGGAAYAIKRRSAANGSAHSKPADAPSAWSSQAQPMAIA